MPPFSNFEGISTLLEESPHIAVYVTRLIVEVPPDSPPADIENLQRILCALVNVRIFIIGELRDVFDTKYHTPSFPSTLLDFLGHQPLRELHVEYTDRVPMAIFLHMLTAAPVISLHNVSVKQDLDEPVSSLPDFPHHTHCKVEDLILEGNESIYALLSCLQP